MREAAPPYGFKDANGEYLGFATDIGKAIYAAVNKELGGAIKANYVAVTSQTRIPLLQNGAIDLEAGATVMTIGRSKVVDFSIPHFVTSTSVLVLPAVRSRRSPTSRANASAFRKAASRPHSIGQPTSAARSPVP